jgi:hypothetical protein
MMEEGKEECRGGRICIYSPATDTKNLSWWEKWRCEEETQRKARHLTMTKLTYY